MKQSQYVGNRDPGTWMFEDTNFTPSPASDNVISITTGNDGLFESATVASGSTVYWKNIARAWASQLQVNTKEIKAEKINFKSKEVNNINS